MRANSLNLFARTCVLIAMSLLFCTVTAVLGAAPLLVLRSNEGRLPFILGTVATSVLLYGLHQHVLLVPFLIMALLVLSFTELLHIGVSFRNASALAVATCAGMIAIFVGYWAKINGIVVLDLMRNQIHDWLSQMPQIQPGWTIDTESVLAQVPAAGLIVLSVSLWMGLLFSRRFALHEGMIEMRQLELRKFTLPDNLIWIFIAAIPGAFLVEKFTLLSVSSLNVFIFFMFLYFLKGLAIVASYFRENKISIFWQALIYVLLVTQLFILVSAVGIADIWINFKDKFLKKSAESMER